MEEGTRKRFIEKSLTDAEMAKLIMLWCLMTLLWRRRWNHGYADFHTWLWQADRAMFGYFFDIIPFHKQTSYLHVYVRVWVFASFHNNISSPSLQHRESINCLDTCISKKFTWSSSGTYTCRSMYYLALLLSWSHKMHVGLRICGRVTQNCASILDRYCLRGLTIFCLVHPYINIHLV